MIHSCTLLFFGSLKDAVGAEKMDISAETPCLIEDIITQITASKPELAAQLRSERIRLLFNGRLVSREFQIDNAGELAFLPPVSGG